MKIEEEEIVDEKDLLEWTNVNRKDIIYLLGRDLLSKDPIAIARAYRMIVKTMDYMDDPNSP